MIFLAVAAPTPGKLSSCCSLALFKSTFALVSVACLPAPEPARALTANANVAMAKRVAKIPRVFLTVPPWITSVLFAPFLGKTRLFNKWRRLRRTYGSRSYRRNYPFKTGPQRPRARKRYVGANARATVKANRGSRMARKVRPLQNRAAPSDAVALRSVSRSPWAVRRVAEKKVLRSSALGLRRAGTQKSQALFLRALLHGTMDLCPSS